MPLYSGVIVSDVNDHPYTGRLLLLIMCISDALKVRFPLLTASHKTSRQARMTRICEGNSRNYSKRPQRSLELWRYP
jgi:hypothetical protein